MILLAAAALFAEEKEKPKDPAPPAPPAKPTAPVVSSEVERDFWHAAHEYGQLATAAKAAEEKLRAVEGKAVAACGADHNLQPQGPVLKCVPKPPAAAPAPAAAK